MHAETVNRLGIINCGILKGCFCLVLYECNYINTDKLKWFKIYVDNKKISMSNNDINFL